MGNKDVIINYYENDYYKYVPLKIAVPSGLDAVTATLSVPKGDNVYSIGSVVLICDKLFKEMPEEFKKDPLLKRTYEAMCMTALISHEGYHLAQKGHPKKGEMVDAKTYQAIMADRPANEVDAYSKEIKFLKKLLNLWDGKTGENAEAMQKTLGHIIKNEEEELRKWQQEKNLKLSYNSTQQIADGIFVALS